MQCGSGGSQRQGLQWFDPRLLKLATGTWNVEPEVVREVERYRLDIVGLRQRTLWVLEPVSLRGVGLCSMLELSKVRGGEQLWNC